MYGLCVQGISTILYTTMVFVLHTLYLDCGSELEIIFFSQNMNEAYSEDVFTQSPVSWEQEGQEDENQLQKEQRTARQQKTTQPQSSGG